MPYANTKDRNSCQLRYYHRNKKKILENQRAAYHSDPKDRIQYGRDYRIKNKAKIAEKNRKYRENRIWRNLARVSNSNAKKRGTGDRITYLDLYKIAKKQKCRCALTGESLTRHNVSVDHILSISKGGKNTPENIRLVTFDVNIARNTLSDSEFLELCKKVVSYHERFVGYYK